MIEKRSDHAVVSMGNKIVVIGGLENLGCEDLTVSRDNIIL